MTTKLILGVPLESVYREEVTTKYDPNSWETVNGVKQPKLVKEVHRFIGNLNIDDYAASYGEITEGIDYIAYSNITEELPIGLVHIEDNSEFGEFYGHIAIPLVDLLDYGGSGDYVTYPINILLAKVTKFKDLMATIGLTEVEPELILFNESNEDI